MANEYCRYDPKEKRFRGLKKFQTGEFAVTPKAWKRIPGLPWSRLHISAPVLREGNFQAHTDHSNREIGVESAR